MDRTAHVSTDPIRVMVADARGQQRLWCRQALADDDGIAVVAEAVNATQLVALAVFEAPDVVVLDAALPNDEGIDVVRELSQRAPRVAVLINLADCGDGADLAAAVRRVADRG